MELVYPANELADMRTPELPPSKGEIWKELTADRFQAIIDRVPEPTSGKISSLGQTATPCSPPRAESP